MEEKIITSEGIISEESLLKEIKIDIEPCPVCLEDIVDPCKTECSHIICKKWVIVFYHF